MAGGNYRITLSVELLVKTKMSNNKVLQCNYCHVVLTSPLYCLGHNVICPNQKRATPVSYNVVNRPPPCPTLLTTLPRAPARVATIDGTIMDTRLVEVSSRSRFAESSPLRVTLAWGDPSVDLDLCLNLPSEGGKVYFRRKSAEGFVLEVEGRCAGSHTNQMIEHIAYYGRGAAHASPPKGPYRVDIIVGSSSGDRRGATVPFTVRVVRTGGEKGADATTEYYNGEITDGVQSMIRGVCMFTV